jgi:stearoyl-CoA desaturase (delta-9 desaturase)
MAAKSRILSQIGNASRRNLYNVQNFLSTLQPNNISFCIILPIIGLVWSFYQPLSRQTFILGGILYIISGVGITAGMTLIPFLEVRL